MTLEKAEWQKKQWSRHEQITTTNNFEGRGHSVSRREWCANNDIPRGTLQYWLKRKQNINSHPDLIQFFESEVGLAFLHRLMIAVHFSFTKVGNASIRDVVRFLEHSQLSDFVASSVGAQYNVSNAIDKAIVVLSKSERKRLSALMPFKKIVLAEDETFHPAICLVAMELRSNYILVERYAEKRDGKTWKSAVDGGLKGLPVEVVKVTGDQGKAIISHAEKELGVHHSPDLFHVQQEIGRGTSGALSSKVKQAEKELDSASRKTQKEVEKQQKHDRLKIKPVGRSPDFEKRVEEAKTEENKAAANLKKTQENQETVRENKLKIGQVYHPYDIETGQKQTPETVEARLGGCFAKIDGATETLSERCAKHVDKARRVVGKMKATIAFFFSMISLIVEEMDISWDVKGSMYDYLIPGFYLLEVAHKEKDRDVRERIEKKARELLSVLENPTSVLARCCENELKSIISASKECAQLFQRSSSAVEGRNAQLSLRHHSMHRLSNLKLSVLTAIHNLYIKRSDGTTAAERLFEAKPKDMFEYLLNNIDLPARARRKRLKLAA